MIISSFGAIFSPIAIFIILALIYTIYHNNQKAKNERHRRDDSDNFRKLLTFAEEFKKANPRKIGHFLAFCRFDFGVLYMVFVESGKKVKDALIENNYLDEANKHDWYAPDGEVFNLINEGFDWYLEKDERLYALPYGQKNRRKKIVF
ncbi:MAG: hypothetical protein K5753_03855 [Clostridia bacterium]|nr:hypothetical protein [Clostridia bacterium]